MEVFSVYEAPFGPLLLAEEDGALTRLSFGQNLPEGAALGETPLLKETKRQLAEYFASRRKAFTVPLAPKGTAFRKKVWQALQTIPFGQTRSYAQIAEQIGSPKACRAVGMANHCNPIAILIPCHRVVGKNGSLTGYAGGLEIKEFLLHLEN